MDMLNDLRFQRDQFLEVGIDYAAMKGERDRAVENSDSLQEEVTALKENEDALTAQLAKAKLENKTLRQTMIDTALADEADEVSVMERSQKRAKSAKHPDPPIFTDGKDPTWDDWSSRMEHKIVANHDWFPSAESKLAYVISRLGGKAAMQTMNRRRRGCENPYHFYSEIIDELAEVYEDSDRVGSVQLSNMGNFDRGKISPSWNSMQS